MSDSRPIIVFVTAPDTDVAASIGRRLVERRLAACCNIVPGLRSIYRWEGKICDDPEVLMVIKSTSEQFNKLEEAVREWHPYDVAEIIAVPISEGSRPYLDWLAQSVDAP